MLVLALDTSTPSITAGVIRLRQPPESIAVVQDGAAPDAVTPTALLAERSVTGPFAHAERLMPLATAALAEAHCVLGDLDAVVVGLGPGPFTGLRVGIATAAALGDGLGIGVHGVPSHDGTARSLGATLLLAASLREEATLRREASLRREATLREEAALRQEAFLREEATLLQRATLLQEAPGGLLVVTDARRREVYLSAYRADGTRVLGPLVAAPAAVPALLAEHLLAPAYLTGAGAALLDPQRGPGFDPTVLAESKASLSLGLVERAKKALLTGAVAGPLTPLYLRRPDATEPGARKSVLGR